MPQDNFHRQFGVGPLGAVISLLLLGGAACMDPILGHPAICTNGAFLKISGGVLVAAGLGLHGWAFKTLRNWWAKDQLCTGGPFRYFRHPLYAAWITFIASGTALFLNSWVYMAWLALLHPIWHQLVKKEEKTMRELFGAVYEDYARKTRRFL